MRNYRFTYQENQFWGSCEPCTLQVFNSIVDSTVVKWKIDTRQAVEAAIREGQSVEPWAKLDDFQKFCLKKEKSEKFRQLTTEQKLTQWVADLKMGLPCFIFGVSDFDAVPAIDKQGNPMLGEDGQPQMKRRRKLEGIQHLSGLFMFDADHLPFDPREVYERTRRDGFPWKVLLAHKTSSGFGTRLVCEARMDLGNIADCQIELARELGLLGVVGTTGKPVTDESCIDAARISYAPRREDIYFIDEEKLFGASLNEK